MEFAAKLDPQKIAMHVALEAGGVDLFKRAKQLTPSQAVDVVAAN